MRLHCPLQKHSLLRGEEHTLVPFDRNAGDQSCRVAFEQTFTDRIVEALAKMRQRLVDGLGEERGLGFAVGLGFAFCAQVSHPRIHI